MNEQAIQHSIMRELRERGCYVIKVQSGTVRSEHGQFIQLAPSGTPDLLIGRPDGLFGAVECKSKTSLSQLQRNTLRRLDEMKLCWAVMDAPEQVAMWLADPSYHGSERYVRQVWTDILRREHIPDPTRVYGLEDSKYAPWAKIRDERMKEQEDRNGPVPF